MLSKLAYIRSAKSEEDKDKTKRIAISDLAKSTRCSFTNAEQTWTLRCLDFQLTLFECFPTLVEKATICLKGIMVD